MYNHIIRTRKNIVHIRKRGNIVEIRILFSFVVGEVFRIRHSTIIKIKRIPIFYETIIRFMRRRVKGNVEFMARNYK